MTRPAFAAGAPVSSSSFLPRARLAVTPLSAGRSVVADPRAARTVVRAVVAQDVSQYDQLAALTTIVEDTGEINYIAEHKPYAATTNPSLVAKAADMPEYEDVVNEAIEYGKKHGGSSEEVLALTRNNLFTRFGARILDLIPGDVSTEVDARLSFDVDAQIKTGVDLVEMYEEMGIGRERVLIKLATTWEGVQACRALEADGIRTNMTLLFGMPQAQAAAEAGAFLISPFVGRIRDYFMKRDGVAEYAPEEDPGVVSVKDIYNFYKCAGHKTVVMGASFRTKDEILQLAGCDRLTIAPKYIADLKATVEPVEHLLKMPTPDQCLAETPSTIDEATFRWQMSQNEMASFKLDEGIRGFAADLESLDTKLKKLII